jgi:voltage-gated sodium channel
MTFEDWTDVMYETMAIYPLSWVYYLSFIFLSAFAFLNMIIGIVVNVLETEHKKLAAIEAAEAGEPSMFDLQRDIHELKRLLEAAGIERQPPKASQEHHETP